MKTYLYASAIALAFCSAAHAEMAVLTVSSNAVVAEKNGAIKPEFAFCVAPKRNTPPRFAGDFIKLGPNKSVDVQWQDAPKNTQSFAVIMTDEDAPVSTNNFNVMGASIANNFPRRTFYDWVLVNIPATTDHLDAGIDGMDSTRDTLPDAQTAYGLRGINSLNTTDPKNIPHKGMLMGYRGPCPPFNDERVHHYTISVYALDVEKLDLPAEFDGTKAMAAIVKHTIGKGAVRGNYSLNPSWQPDKNSTPVAAKPR